MEQLSPKDARAILTGAQSSVKVNLSGTEVTNRTIKTNGQKIKLPGQLGIEAENITEGLGCR